MPEPDGQGGTARQPIAFISHHSSQVEQARHIARILERHGIKGWMAPDDIEPGKPFDQVIMEQIGKCDVILLLFSARSDQSKHVKREVMLAEQHGKLIYPIRLESIQPDGLAYWLQDYQWIDWLDGRDEAIERMVATIRRQLSLPEAAPPEASASPTPAPPSPAAVPPSAPVVQSDASTPRKSPFLDRKAAIALGAIGSVLLLTIIFVGMASRTTRDNGGVLPNTPSVAVAPGPADALPVPNAAPVSIRPGSWAVRYRLTDYSSDFPGTSEQRASAVVASYSGTACITQAQANDPGTTVMTAFTANLPNCQVRSNGARDGDINAKAVCRNPADSLHTEVDAEGSYGADTVNVEYDMTQWYETLGEGQTIDSTISMTARRLGNC